jgi:hypothetical protein
MDLFSLDLLRPYLTDVLGSAASAATLLTFAQKRMWPMRISAIAANLFFIGYGALGLLYPVLFLHLVLLPLNVARLIQLVEQDRGHRTFNADPTTSVRTPSASEQTDGPPLFGGGREQVGTGSLSARSMIWDFIRPAPP